VDRRGDSSSLAFELRHVAQLAEHFLQTEDSPRDVGKVAVVSSAAPDGFSYLGSCTPPIFLNSPMCEIGNPKMREKSYTDIKVNRV